LTLVTTRDNPVGFSAIADVIDWLAGTGFSQWNIELRLPRFLIRRTTDLLPALDEAGLRHARRDPSAFARLTRKPVDISAIIQKVYLKVDEQGSEAAAATAIVDHSITAKPSVANSVTFDKPFIFALRDQMTGLFLLSGYVGSLLAETVADSCASARDCPQK
jgi:serine protease inhibitor